MDHQKIDALGCPSLIQSGQPESPTRIGRQVDFNQLNHEMKFFPSHEFVLTAATVTLKDDDNVLIVKNTNPKYDETFYTLPGGRKNLYEALEQAAIRETLEETGYHVRLPSAAIHTRATRPRSAGCCPLADQDECHPARPDATAGLPHIREGPGPTIDGVIDDCNKEPVGMIMYRDPLAEEPCLKLRFFFYAKLVDPEAEPNEPVLDHGEHVQALWVSVTAALGMLRFEAEKKAVASAYALHILDSWSVVGSHIEKRL